MALKLLEDLKLNDIDFVFKGGTSLLLMFDKMYRFSVDIDIIIEKDYNYDKYFDSICHNVFTHWDKHERGEEQNIKHFRFYYRPFVDEIEESYILLDVYEGKCNYKEVYEVELKSSMLKQVGENVFVKIPSIDSILADKLTAFAPHTIGIKLSAEPGKRPKRVEILKQMFDVANLFDRCCNLGIIKETYIKIANEEIKIAKLNCDYIDVLKDSFDFAIMIGFDGKKNKEEFSILSKGYSEFSKFVVDLSFDKMKAILCASKVAYLVVSILKDRKIEKYKDTIDLTNYTIQDKEYKDFANYLYSCPEAYYYFVEALNLLNQ